ERLRRLGPRAPVLGVAKWRVRIARRAPAGAVHLLPDELRVLQVSAALHRVRSSSRALDRGLDPSLPAALCSRRLPRAQPERARSADPEPLCADPPRDRRAAWLFRGLPVSRASPLRVEAVFLTHPPVVPPRGALPHDADPP